MTTLKVNGKTFSGNVIPLTLFPDGLQALIRYQPFAQALDAPIRMYQQCAAAPEWLLTVAVQVGWIIVLRLVGRKMWQKRCMIIITKTRSGNAYESISQVLRRLQSAL